MCVHTCVQADAFEKYNETSVTDCMKKLKKTNEKLKKFDGVNKKALDMAVLEYFSNGLYNVI